MYVCVFSLRWNFKILSYWFQKITRNKAISSKQAKWSQMWWHTPVIPALREQRQEEANLGYTVRPCLKKPKSSTVKTSKHKIPTKHIQTFQSIHLQQTIFISYPAQPRPDPALGPHHGPDSLQDLSTLSRPRGPGVFYSWLGMTLRGESARKRPWGECSEKLAVIDIQYLWQIHIRHRSTWLTAHPWHQLTSTLQKP
jgi:hypothetical protein